MPKFTNRFGGLSRNSVIWALLVAGGLCWGSCARKVPEKPLPPPTPMLTPEEERAAGALLQRAQRHYGQGRKGEALRTYERLLEGYPGSTLADDAIYWIGRIQYEEGAPEQAAGNLGRLLERYPSSDLIDESRLWLGKSYLALKRYDDAVMILEDLIKANPDPVRKAGIARDLGDAYEAVGKPERATGWLLAARAGFDEEDREYGELGSQIERIVTTAEDMKQLENIADRYDREFPGDLALIRLMRLYTEKDDLAAAQDKTEAFLDHFPGHPLESKVRERLLQLRSHREVSPNRIGVLLPLSGRFAVFGQRALRGIELALQQKTRQGAKPAEFVIRDTKGDPAQALKALEELYYEQHVIAVLGPLLGITAAPVAARAEELEVPIVTLSQRGGLPEIGPYVFRCFMTPEDQVRTIVRHAVEVRGDKTFAVIYPENALGRHFMMSFWKEVEAQGGWVTAADSYEPDATDFKSPLSRMSGQYYPDARQYARAVREALSGSQWEEFPVEKIEYAYWQKFRRSVEEPQQKGKKSDAPKWPPEAGPLPPVVDFDAVFIPDRFEQVALIAPQLVYNDVLGVDLLGVAAWDDPRLATLGERYVEGSVFVDGFFIDSERAAVRKFVGDYRQVFNEDPTLLEITAHDGAMLLRHLAERDEPPRLRTQLRRSLLAVKGLPLLLGEISFEEDGAARIPLTLLTVANQRISEVRLTQGSAIGGAASGSEAP